MADVTVDKIYLYLASELQTTSRLVAPTDGHRIILKGLEVPRLDGVEEWLAFELLNVEPKVCRRSEVIDCYSFQLTCYSLESAQRTDRKFHRHYELASAYRSFMHQRDYALQNTCIRFKECKMTLLDLRSTTSAAKPIAAPGTPLLHVQAAVLLCDAMIIKPKDDT